MDNTEVNERCLNGLRWDRLLGQLEALCRLCAQSITELSLQPWEVGNLFGTVMGPRVVHQLIIIFAGTSKETFGLVKGIFDDLYRTC